MTGDGLQDIVLLRNGNIAYWPNLGLRPLRAAGADAQRTPAARRVRPAAGAARRRRRRRRWPTSSTSTDGRVLLWGNQSGNAWTPSR